MSHTSESVSSSVGGVRLASALCSRRSVRRRTGVMRTFIQTGVDGAADGWFGESGITKVKSEHNLAREIVLAELRDYGVLKSAACAHDQNTK